MSNSSRLRQIDGNQFYGSDFYQQHVYTNSPNYSNITQDHLESYIQVLNQNYQNEQQGMQQMQQQQQQLQEINEQQRIQRQRQRQRQGYEQIRQFICYYFKQLNIRYDEQNWQTRQNIEILQVLLEILSYPNNQTSQNHRKANRLGLLDLKQQNQQELQNLSQQTICLCCKLKLQNQSIKFNKSINDVKNVGISTHLYFITIQNLIFLLLTMFSIFSLYAILINSGSTAYMDSKEIEMRTQQKLNQILDFVTLSSQKQQNIVSNNFSQQIMSWLITACIIAWGGLFIYLKKREKYKQLQIKKQEITQASYALVFQNMPKLSSQFNLQNSLQQYRRQVIRQNPQFLPQFYQKQIQIQQISQLDFFQFNHSIYQNDKQLNRKKQLLNQQKKWFIDWINKRIQKSWFFRLINNIKKYINRNNQNDISLQQHMKRFQKLTEQIYLIQSEKPIDIYLQNFKRMQAQSPLSYLVIFKHVQNKQFIQNIHKHQSSFVINKFCVKKIKQFNFNINNKLIKLKIEPSLKPEQYKWIKSVNYFKKLSTFQKNLLNLGICLAIMILNFLIVLSINEMKNSQKIQNNTDNYLLSICSTFIIWFFNRLTSYLLNRLTYTFIDENYSKQQSSVGIKLAIFQSINLIIIPILINLFIKENIHKQGLVQDVLFNSIFSVLNPLTDFVNFWYLICRVWYWWKSRPQQKLGIIQLDLNRLNENTQFPIGSSYANIIAIYFFTCFFIPLQPVIVIFTILGFILTYYTSKFNLYYRSRRPINGTLTINNEMFQLILLGPMLYTLGSFIWINKFVPSIFSLFLSVIILFIPYQKLANNFTSQAFAPYDQNKSKFPLLFKDANIFYKLNDQIKIQNPQPNTTTHRMNQAVAQQNLQNNHQQNQLLVLNQRQDQISQTDFNRQINGLGEQRMRNNYMN